jgi:hypothetical protein
MKRYENSRFNYDKYRTQKWHTEHKSGGFRCAHCRQFVVINDMMGTANRNHCNVCLWSKHVDETKGDRRADCNGGMAPVGLTFRQEGHGRVGEITLIHLCSTCQKISINRIARDDLETEILHVFTQSLSVGSALRKRLMGSGIYLLTSTDKEEVASQLFGSRL